MLDFAAKLRSVTLLTAVGFLAACANGENLGEARVELGDFRLCHNIVTTNDAVQGPLSREADLDVFADLIRDEMERRFDRYQGDRLYHLALHIDAYVLAVPGIPIVASPKSALIASVNIWDDQLGRAINEEPEQFTVLEAASGGSLIGSGLTQNAEEQMQHLARNAALRIESWLAENPEWFEHASETGDAEDGEATADETAEDEADQNDTPTPNEDSDASPVPEDENSDRGQCGRH